MSDRLELKAAVTVEATGEITGIAWPYGSADRVGDVIEKGAFIASATLPILWAHDQAEAIGVWDQITDTPEGLTVKGRLLIEDVAKAREVHALIRAGAVTGLSVGFQTKAATPRQRGRTITRAELHEISVVAVPCHPGAQITALKGNPQSIEPKGDMMENEDLAPKADTVPANEAPVIDIKAFDAMKARLEALELKAQRPGVSAPAIVANDERKSFDAFLRTGDRKALNVGTASAGGVLAPSDTSSEILQKIAEYSPVRGLASVITMDGPLLQLPRLVNDVTVAGVTEMGARPESEPTFEQIDLKPFEMAVTIPVTRVMLEDAAMNLEAFLTGHLAQRFGQLEAAWFINGNGTTAAQGILTETAVSSRDVSLASANALGDAIVDTFYGIKSAYSARAAWLMNRATMARVRKLKDSTGAFLWQAGLAPGQPDMLMGRPVYEAVDLADPAVGATSIVFGDFAAAYTIADRRGLTILRDDYTGAANGIVKLHASRRVGGRVVMPEAITKLKFIA